jgi:hypothetical protein
MAVRLDDPQTWNMYAYVRNNPTTLTDPSGLEPQEAEGSCTNTNADTCQGNKSGLLDRANDVMTGASKELQNNLFFLLNLDLDAMTNGRFTPFPELQPDNSDQAIGMAAAGIMMMAVPGGGEEEAVVTVEETTADLTAAAGRAAETVGEGSGAVYGTKVHTAFKAEVDAMGNGTLEAEQSFRPGEGVVRYGARGSVRADVVQRDAQGNVAAVYDLKTGRAMLTPARVQQIREAIGVVVRVIQISVP